MQSFKTSETKMADCVECAQPFDMSISYVAQPIPGGQGNVSGNLSGNLSALYFKTTCHPCYLDYISMCWKDW